jgi:putative Mn2+ efflux pump MntP
MDLVPALGLSAGLAMDAFAVSLAIGASRASISRTEIARVAFAFGAFQGAMPVAGWFVGGALLHWIVMWDHWIAFLILAAVGIRMIVGSLRGLPAFRSDPTGGAVLLGLAIATSIDALAAGFSLAMLRSPILAPALMIGGVTFVSCAAALRIGRRAGIALGRWAEGAGGVVLVAIGLNILFGHLRGGI